MEFYVSVIHVQDINKQARVWLTAVMLFFFKNRSVVRGSDHGNATWWGYVFHIDSLDWSPTESPEWERWRSFLSVVEVCRKQIETNKQSANLFCMQFFLKFPSLLCFKHCGCSLLRQKKKWWQNKGATESYNVVLLVNDTLRVQWRPRSAEHIATQPTSCDPAFKSRWK